MPVKFITPEPIKIGEVRAAINSGLQASGEIVKTDYRLFTGTWTSENEPVWVEKLRSTSGTREWRYETSSTPMVWIDDGTKGPYPIPKVPKPPGEFLAFQTGFIPKTTPNKITSGPGARFGPTRFAKQVMHPGIADRNISNKIGEEAEPHLSRLVQKNLDGVRSL